MDPLSITASIIAVLKLTSEVVGYLRNTKNAPEERALLVSEASTLNQLLLDLASRIAEGHSGEPWYNAIESLAAPNGALDQYKTELERFRRKVEVTSGAGKVMHAVVWKFNKAEVEGMLSRMERLKSLILIALEMDHL